MAVFLAVLLAAAPVAAAELVIRIVGLRSGLGTMHYAVYDAPERFPYEGGVVKGNVPAGEGGTVIHLSPIAPGKYAVAVFHDENRNGAFDQGLLGIPLEDYGFSNNASGLFGPPSFESAAFVVTEPTVEIVIDLRR